MPRVTGEIDQDFEALLHYLEQNRGFDFTGYKRPSLMRRVIRRMETVGVPSFADYVDYLEVHPDEFAQLFNTVLINVTSFFRDPQAWDFLRQEVVPAIVAGKQPDEPIRIWSAGCASGEEAYSAAILFAEALGEQAYKARVKVYATDVDEEALAQARMASYGNKEMETLEPVLRQRYFEVQHGRYVFRNDLRRAVIFGRHDLGQDAPISRLDLLICRNAIMYFNAESQARVLAKFHFALNGNGNGRGFLFLGRAEMLVTHSGLFTPLDLKCRVFEKVSQAGGRLRPPAAAAPSGNGGHMERNDSLREQALEESPVARIVVDPDGLLALANQRARALFSISVRDIGRPLRDLEICYRPVELQSMIEQAYVEGHSITRSKAERCFAEGEPQYLDVTVAPYFDESRTPAGVGISFLDVTRYYKLQEELSQCREEIQSTNEALQCSNEELETTNEELQSSNEELETTNEELQSTNEELETMNEELQSTNEELQTVNEELRQRTDDLRYSNAFLESVLGSLRAGAVVVNQNLDILVWNHRAEDLWGLRAPEVQGKGLLNLDIGLPVGELRDVIRPCLAGDADHKEVVLDAINRRGRKIKCRIACTPLISSGNHRQGVILMMDEIV
jgi:two-component system CheB/CheR fusion protein